MNLVDKSSILILNDFSLDKKIKFLKFDVSKLKSIEKYLKQFFKIYGTPDCLINCSYPVLF